MSPVSKSLHAAVGRLGDALKQPDTDMNRDASIQRFEFSFELAWKAMQKALREQGLDCASPRACLQAAYRQGWIEEDPWLSMLEDRNQTAHTYDERLAREIYSRLPGHHTTLAELLGRLP